MTTLSGDVSRALLLLAAPAAGCRSAPPARRDGRPRRAVLRTYCRKCHSGAGRPDQGRPPVLDRGALLRRKVVRPGQPADSELFQLVDCGSMPPGDLPKPTPAEVDVLREWIGDGTPDFPPESGDTYVMKKIRTRPYRLQSLHQNDPADQRDPLPYQRYVSFNHLLAEDAAPDLALWRTPSSRRSTT